MRRFAIGDIHGCAKALRTLVETINPQRDDELIFLGDYVDRGPDSRDVVEQILELQHRCNVIALRGNHEIMLVAVHRGDLAEDLWMANGGRATISSYGGSLDKIPDSHLAFFERLKPFHETTDSIFVHAGYAPTLPMHQQEPATLFWEHLPAPPPPPHVSGKRVFVGHTPQPYGAIFNGGHLVAIDTYCFGGGFLTAFDVDSDGLIQTDIHGFLRRAPGQAFAERFGRFRDRVKALLNPQPDSPADQDTAAAEPGLNTAPADEPG